MLPAAIPARAIAVLRRGGVIAYPTEAVYGLGCLPRNARAVQRLLRIKGRPRHKGLILIAANTAQLKPYVATLTEQVLATWPGPYTWLLPARPRTPRWLRGHHDSIAVRVTAHPLARSLCLRAGSALVSTSANRAHRKPARSYRAVAQSLGKDVDFIVRGRVGRARKPTQIADARSGRVVRAGT